MVCQALGLSRSSYYYRPKERDDTECKSAILEAAGTCIRLLVEFVYLAVIMDVFTRCIRGWHLARSLHQDLTLTGLRRALVSGRRPAIHHSDQGVQYAAIAYTDTLQSHHIAISMAEAGAAWQNGYAERLIRTIKEEEVDLSDYRDYHDAYRQLGRFLDDVYMHKRIHSSLGYLTPAEFEHAWLAEQANVGHHVQSVRLLRLRFLNDIVYFRKEHSHE